MAKLITVLTKKPEEQWLLITKDSTNLAGFTQSEIDDVIRPYHEYVRSLPGIDTTKFQVITEGDTSTNIVHFDTIENAQNAKALLYDDIRDEVVMNKNRLIKSKQNGVRYDRNVYIEE